MKKYFLVYNDPKFKSFIDKLTNSVKIHGNDFEIITFNKSDIDNEFIIKNEKILKCGRGGGYWLWKPYIISQTLKKINEGDIVFYLDSKYYFIEDFTNLYQDYMDKNDILVWKNKPNEPVWYMKNWCKMETIIKYDLFEKVFNDNAEDCWGGALIVKNNEKGIKYIQEWLDMCCNYEDITDSPSKIKNNPLFREHRHDQSLLSIVLHKYNITLQLFEKKHLQNARVPF